MEKWKEQCEVLWGDRWKSTLARTAGVSKRTVQRWHAGVHRIPQRNIDKIDETFKIWEE